MYAEFQKSPKATALAAEMGKIGFRYAGDTNSGSKANTKIESKTIRIKKNIPLNEAALSLVYELANASQASEFKQIMVMLKKEPTPELANAYAEGILRKEAKSVLARSHMAIEMNCPELIKNKRYNEIAEDVALTRAEKEEACFAEMRQNGKVHRGTRNAYDYYVEQFWQENKFPKA